MRIHAAKSVVLVIDLQSRLLPAIHGNHEVLSEAIWLIDVARQLRIPVIATEHCPQRIGVTDKDLLSHLLPEEILEKTHFSAVASGKLIQAAGGDRSQWIVVGAEAHVCVQQTVLDLLSIGRQVFVVEAGVGSRRVRDKELALGRMKQNSAEIVSREMVAFEWLESADNPKFREVLHGFIR